MTRIVLTLILASQLQGCFFFVFPLPKLQAEPEQIEREAKR